MKLSYSPLSSLTIVRPKCKLFGHKSCNVRTICSPISPSLGFRRYNGRSDSKNVSAKHYKLNFIRCCTPAESDPIVTKQARSFWDVCLQFLRSYSMKGTAIASTCLFARALMENPSLIHWSLALKALSGLFVLLCANGYTGVINQIYDIDIDKINKPYYPIPAGDLSVESAWLMVLFSASVGLAIVGVTCGPLITCVYGLVLLLGTAYSIPPLRLKTIPFGTILYLALSRGILFNFGVYYSLKATLGLAFQWSPPLVFITIFGTIMGAVVAITKDLSDVEGDSKFEITTLATKFGVKNVAYIGCGIMLFCYGASIVTAICMPQVFRRSLMIAVHLILALLLIYQTRMLDQANYSKEAGLKYYMFIWSLYYAEYIVFPFI